MNGNVRRVSSVFTAVLLSAPLAALAGAPDWVLETKHAGWRQRDSQGRIRVPRAPLDCRGLVRVPSKRRLATCGRPPTGDRGSSSRKPPPWRHSDLPMSLAFQGRMWMMGGWYNGRLPGHSASNQVWWSTDGVTWQRATMAAGWSPRIAAGTVEFRGRMWILGGTEDYYFGNDKSLKNDVWSSADGNQWKLETSKAGWSPRAYHQAVALHDKIYVFGGGNYAPAYHARNDVWSSADGVNWTCEDRDRSLASAHLVL